MSTLTVDSRVVRPLPDLSDPSTRGQVGEGVLPADGSAEASAPGRRTMRAGTDHDRLRRHLENAVERMNDVRLSLEARGKYLHELRRIRAELDQLEAVEEYGMC